MKKSAAACIGLVFLTFAAGAILYPQMPKYMATHWNISGEADSYSEKFWGVFLLPTLSLAVYFIMAIIPLIDPLKENIKTFRRYYDGFIVLMMLFFSYLQALVLAWNLGYVQNMNIALPPAFAAVFWYAGVLMEKAKKNWFIGIRTPWTLSSETVWEKTHRLGSMLYKAAAIIALLGLLTPEYSFYFIVAPMLAFSAYLMLYSYLEYRKEKK